MGHADYFKAGSHNVICDCCGFKFKREQVKKDWQGFLKCSTCYEPRHSLDFLRSVPERPGVIDARPRQEPYFLDDNENTKDDL
jgi:hypothetical protein